MIQRLTDAQVLEKIKARPRPKSQYFAMYSSLWDGITTEVHWMQVPIDDHLVHRGDGIFEAMRFSYGAVFDFDAHMDRLEKSASMVGLEIPRSRSQVADILKAMVKISGAEQAMVRLYVSRGPGGFTTNPYESLGSQLYIVLTDLKLLSQETYDKGVSADFSKVAIKPSPWSQVKSCNYLQNVMMKKEAVDAGVFMTIGLTPEGYLAEGSTENVAFIIDRSLVVPKFEYTLRGTTLLRVMDLAKKHQAELGISSVQFADLKKDQVLRAEEAFFIGTTLEILPITQMAGAKVGSGHVGLFAKKMRELLQHEMKNQPQARFVIS